VTSSAHRIDGPLLQRLPPRPLPLWVIADLIGDQLAERPLRSYIDPLLICGLVAAVALALLRAPIWLSWGLALLMGVRLGMIAWEFLGRSLLDFQLLRYGILVRAHVLRSRANKTISGLIHGAYLDCVIPVGRGRTSVGSVWLSDVQEADRLAMQGRVQVICLPKAPGTWRLLEGKCAEFRYELSEENRPIIDKDF
jgi:hypothetical protein